jgi:hypothetical protein
MYHANKDRKVFMYYWLYSYSPVLHWKFI